MRRFVKRLFEDEIPEITDGTVMIYSVAREAGNRSKVAVYSPDQNIDPVGSCVGQKGVRIQNIINELNGEKIEPAQSFENVIGIVAGNPSFVADTAALDWHGRYKTDNFGRYMLSTVGDIEETDEYDNTQTYIPRELRKEWAPVSILGKVYVRHDGTVQTGGFVTLKENGIGCAGESGYRVLKRIDNESALVLVK